MNDLALINAYTQSELKENDVFTFSFVVCDNEVDRDIERFSEKSLKQIKEKIVGKPIITDHYSSNDNQIGRVYKTETKNYNDKITSYGKRYQQTIAYAYMLNNLENESLIEKIKGGIIKNGSIGFKVAERVCSICGKKNNGSFWEQLCEHKSGEVYNGNKRHVILDDVSDVYEWSFVAVPAQPMSGIISANDKSAENINLNEKGSNVMGKFSIGDIKCYKGGGGSVKEFDDLVQTKSQSESESTEIESVLNDDTIKLLLENETETVQKSADVVKLEIELEKQKSANLELQKRLAETSKQKEEIANQINSTDSEKDKTILALKAEVEKSNAEKRLADIKSGFAKHIKSTELIDVLAKSLADDDMPAFFSGLDKFATEVGKSALKTATASGSYVAAGLTSDVNADISPEEYARQRMQRSENNHKPLMIN